MARKTTYFRRQDGEHVINEQSGTMSRETVTLIADATGYKPGRVLAKLTSGANAGKWCKWDPAGADGAAVAKGVLYTGRRASTGTQKGVAHVRDCDLNGKKMLIGPEGTSDANKAAAIAQLLSKVTADNTGGIRVRF